jgi:hypothetical protein
MAFSLFESHIDGIVFDSFSLCVLGFATACFVTLSVSGFLGHAGARCHLALPHAVLGRACPFRSS